MTTTNRVRAGSPPPTVLHRGAPLDFTLPADDDQAVNNGFDQAMKAPIRKPAAEAEPAADATKDQTAADFVFWFWSRALWTVSWFGLGILYARHFS